MDSAKLVEMFRAGDDEAAEVLFKRYVNRLIRVAHNRLSTKLARRIDPEDVVQSVFRSFFEHARRGRYEIDEEGELWSLLAAITVNKIRRKVELNTAKKRGVDMEQSAFDGPEGQYQPQAISAEPLPADVLGLMDEVALLTRDLEDFQKRIVELRLAGYRLDEIAEDVSMSERTVRRVLDKVKVHLDARMASHNADD